MNKHQTKLSSLQVAGRLILAPTLVGCWGLVNFGVLPSAAQNFQNQGSAIEGLVRPNEPGSTIGGDNNGLNMFNLILRSQNTPSRTVEEVTEQQQRSLNASSEEFRRQQLERIRNAEATTNPSSPGNP